MKAPERYQALGGIIKPVSGLSTSYRGSQMFTQGNSILRQFGMVILYTPSAEEVYDIPFAVLFVPLGSITIPEVDMLPNPSRHCASYREHLRTCQRSSLAYLF